MKNNSRKNKKTIRISHRYRVRTGISLRSTLAIYTAGSVSLILFFFAINLSNHFEAKANEIEIIPLQEQNFTNEMAIPEPYLSNQKKGSPNSIYIHPQKKEFQQVQENHE